MSGKTKALLSIIMTCCMLAFVFQNFKKHEFYSSVPMSKTSTSVGSFLNESDQQLMQTQQNFESPRLGSSQKIYPPKTTQIHADQPIKLKLRRAPANKSKVAIKNNKKKKTKKQKKILRRKI